MKSSKSSVLDVMRSRMITCLALYDKYTAMSEEIKKDEPIGKQLGVVTGTMTLDASHPVYMLSTKYYARLKQMAADLGYIPEPHKNWSMQLDEIRKLIKEM